MNLGLQFQASSDGLITGVRFYKEADNTGTHTGSLWAADGTLLATGTFTGESASGWQELDFSSPVPVTAGTTYVASYHTSPGHYAYTSGGLASPVANGPLTALASGGVYAYGSADDLPLQHLQRIQLLGRRRLHPFMSAALPWTPTPAQLAPANIHRCNWASICPDERSLI